MVYGGFEFNAAGTRVGLGDIAYVAAQDVPFSANGWVKEAKQGGSTGDLWMRLGSADDGFNFVRAERAHADVESDDGGPGGAAPGGNEVQRITLHGTGGTFRLSFNGNLTGPLTLTTSEADMRTALRGLAGIVDVAVARSVSDFDGDGTNEVRYTIRFDDPGNTNVSQLAVNSAGLTDSSFASAARNAYPVDIVAHPDDWRQLFVLDSLGRVWYARQTTPAPFSKTQLPTFTQWTELTGNLRSLSPDLRTLQIVVNDKRGNTNAGDDEVSVLVGGLGGVFRTTLDLRALTPGTPPPLVYNEFGRGLPNVLVMDLRYDSRDQLLLAGTLGRGAWTIPNADAALKQESLLRILGAARPGGLARADQIVLRREADQPWLLDVFVSRSTGVLPATPSATIQLSSLARIEIDGRDAGDTVLIDGAHGPVSVPDGIRVFDTGNSAGDVLRVENHAQDRDHRPNAGRGAGIDIQEPTRGGGGSNEMLQVTVEAVGGTFTLSFGANTTPPLAFDASAVDVTRELQRLPGITAVNVVRTVGDFDADRLNETRYAITVTNPANTRVVLTSNALSLIGSYQFTDTDSFGGDRVVQIQVSQVEDIPIVHLGPNPPPGNILSHTFTSEVQGGLEELMDLSRRMFDTAAGTGLAVMNADTLSAALNRELLEELPPRPRQPKSTSQVTADGLAQADLGGSVLQRVLAGAFDLGALPELLARGPLALQQALQGIDPAGVVRATKLDGVTPIGAADSFAEGVVFQVQLTKQLRGVVDLRVAGDALLSQLGLSNALRDAVRIEGAAEISADISLNLTFRVDSQG